MVDTITLGDPVAAEDAARSHVEAVWFRLAEQQHQADAVKVDPLQRAASHLAFRSHCRLRLSEVAAKVAFTSAGNLPRLFRLRYGMNFRAYLQKLRLEKAAELLASTRLPVGTIARRVGYRDFSRFGLHFKRMHGVEPRRWRALEVAKAGRQDVHQLGQLRSTLSAHRKTGKKPSTAAKAR